MDRKTKATSSRVNICGVDIDNVSIRETLGIIKNIVEERKNAYILTPNVDHIIKTEKDSEFAQLYAKADLVVADGMPILWASMFLGTPLKEKVSGSDLFPKICKIAAGKNYSIFLLGGRPGAALKAKEIFLKDLPTLKIAGLYCPPHGFDKDAQENKKIVNIIQKSRPDILLVALGTPKQEKWIYKHKDEYSTPLSIGVGASFDFASGFVKRAPHLIQKMGLEWLWRLMLEPKRLWKRYLIDDMKFFWLVLKQKILILKKIKS